jgi:2-keto-4-pentenoate hydratase
MTEPSNIAQAAQYLAQRYEARESMDILLQDFAPTTIADAYQVQDAFLDILGKSRGPIGGYKVAYTSDEMRRLRGIRSQCAGGMFARTIQSSPATVRSADT